MANPFDILHLNLFNLFITQGYVTLQRHYMAILLRLYGLAEFNRFGLTREVVIAEIMDYLRDAHAEEETSEAVLWIKVEMANQTQGEVDAASTANPKPKQDYASFLIRRLLTLISKETPIYLWSDMDYGGFNILAQLRKQINPRIQPYHMDIPTFENYAHLSRPLTQRDKSNLKCFLFNPNLKDIHPTIEHLLQRGLKLELEAIQI